MYGNPKRFGVEGMRMRVGRRWYQAFPRGGDGGSQSTAMGSNFSRHNNNNPYGLKPKVIWTNLIIGYPWDNW
uniref:Uncharacterized protein n=1 Tax=Romanomermis culicivorax TaxID=13658 RepID=A0A915KPI9_ROMCU